MPSVFTNQSLLPPAGEAGRSVLEMMWPFKTKWQQEAEESDYGRRYGWTIEVNDSPIGLLTCIRWDAAGQFWHQYQLELDGDKYDGLRSDADLWRKLKIKLRNIRFRDIEIKEFLVVPNPDNSVMVRFASVPPERFRKP